MKHSKDPLVSDQETGVYFWCHTDANGDGVNFSNRPHSLLPIRCDRHDWWTDKPCRACGTDEYMRTRDKQMVFDFQEVA